MHRIAALVSVCLVAGCVGDIDGPEADGDGDDGEGVAALAVSANTIDIGFNGEPNQFPFMAEFWAKTTITPRPRRLCHGYFPWNVAVYTAARAELDTWLAAAQTAQCDEALIAFKSPIAGTPPGITNYRAAVTAIVNNDWQTEAGFSGALSFTAWNEPNNPDPAGNGLGVQIPPRLAADYYMALEVAAAASPACARHGGCKVAAGDFASNGTMWTDLSWNCANDNVVDLCAQFSSKNPTGAPASYLDIYKNEIALHATDHGLPAGFRPAYFAFHGWHDTNGFLYNGDTACSSYDDCAVRRLLKSLGGSWSGVALWDTEDGMGQKGPLSPQSQACGAAFLLRLQTITDRVERIYVTRLYGGFTALELGLGHPRPAFDVLLNRETVVPGC